MFLTSFKTQVEAVSIPPSILPRSWNPSSYLTLSDKLPFWRMYGNTVLTAVILVTALGGVTLPIGRTGAALTPLALASLAGIVLNAIFPAGDYAARAADDEPPKGNTFEV